MKPYRYIHLDSDSKKALELAYKTDTRHHVRQKCQIILLSNEGHKVPQLAIMFNKHCDTIRDWFNAYEQSGISCFAIKPGRGVKSKLDKDNPELEQFIKKS